MRRNTFYTAAMPEHRLTVYHNRVVRGEAVYRCIPATEQLIRKITI